MSRDPEPWGGELIVTRWLRRFRTRDLSNDTTERQQEAHDHRDRPAGKSDPYNSAADMLGGAARWLPPAKDNQRGR